MTRSGNRTRGREPVSARTRSPAIQPSGATLNTPSRRCSTARATADARSSRWRNCAGGSSSPKRWPSPAARARASEDVPSAAIATTGRSTVTVRPGADRRHRSVHRLDRRQLAGVHELDVRAQHGVLGQRDRVVGVGAVDERRRDQHHVSRSAHGCILQHHRCALGHALAAPCPQVVIASPEMDDHVARLRRPWLEARVRRREARAPASPGWPRRPSRGTGALGSASPATMAASAGGTRATLSP